MFPHVFGEDGLAVGGELTFAAVILSVSKYMTLQLHSGEAEKVALCGNDIKYYSLE